MREEERSRRRIESRGNKRRGEKRSIDTYRCPAAANLFPLSAEIFCVAGERMVSEGEI